MTAGFSYEFRKAIRKNAAELGITIEVRRRAVSASRTYWFFIFRNKEQMNLYKLAGNFRENYNTMHSGCHEKNIISFSVAIHA